MNLTWTPYLPLRTQIIELDVHMYRQIYAYNKLLHNYPFHLHSSHAREGMEGQWKGVVDR